MGQFKQMAIIEAEQQASEFVPSNPQINGQPTSLVWRNRLGPVKIVDAGYTDESKTELVIVLANGQRFTCLSSTFGGGSIPQQLRDATKLVLASGQLVELCVARNPVTRNVAPGYFCGFRLAGSKSGTGLIGL